MTAQQHQGIDSLDSANERSEDLVGYARSFQKEADVAEKETDSGCCCFGGKKKEFDAEKQVAAKHKQQQRQSSGRGDPRQHNRTSGGTDVRVI